MGRHVVMEEAVMVVEVCYYMLKDQPYCVTMMEMSTLEVAAEQMVLLQNERFFLTMFY